MPAFLRTLALILMCSLSLLAETTPPDWPIELELVGDWKADRVTGSRTKNYQLEQGRGNGLMLRIDPSIRSEDEIASRLEFQAKMMIEQLKAKSTASTPPEDFKMLSINGDVFRGHAVEMEIAPGRVMGNLIVTDGDRFWSGNFHGDSASWKQALHMVSGMRRSGWNDVSAPAKIISEEEGPDGWRAILIERETTPQSFHLSIIKDDADPLATAGNVAIVDQPGVKYFWNGRRLVVDLPAEARTLDQTLIGPEGSMTHINFQHREARPSKPRKPLTHYLMFDLPEGWAFADLGSITQSIQRVENGSRVGNIFFMDSESMAKAISNEETGHLFLQQFADSYAGQMERADAKLDIGDPDWQKIRGRAAKGEAVVFESNLGVGNTMVMAQFYLSDGQRYYMGSFQGQPDEWTAAKKILASARPSPAQIE